MPHGGVGWGRITQLSPLEKPPSLAIPQVGSLVYLCQIDTGENLRFNFRSSFGAAK